MVAQLGQTFDPKALIPGEPEVISSDLSELVDPINVADQIGSTLGTIDPVGWIGDAASSFRSVFSEEPPKWGRAVEAIGKGGEHLADYADVLTCGQGEAQRAIELYHQAQAATRARRPSTTRCACWAPPSAWGPSARSRTRVPPAGSRPSRSSRRRATPCRWGAARWRWPWA
ncbi:putative T7SS-secreted protein [Saccharomonospora sp. CUA-673]|uniref:putative T7SS-secreted protein n=1 Tax=Saccharomonospora sp. CUA-673 TaxID=1904969 RepID=UPI003519A043